MPSLQQLRNRPNFFMIGAAKTATTRMHYLLGQHPEVFASSFKEPHFFNESSPSAAKIERYLELFHDVGAAKAIGESTTGYSRNQTHPGTARRLWEFNSEAKIIYVARHPMRRIESYWIQLRSMDYPTSPNFCESVRDDSFGIIEATLYWQQLEEYRKFFPDEQILVLFFEEFIADEAATMRRYFEFLEVDPNFEVNYSDQERKNGSSSKKQASPLLDFLDSHRVWPFHFKSENELFQRTISAKLKRKLRSFLRKPVVSKPKWDEQTWHWTVQQLRADNERFLAYAGKPIDFWNWELEA